MRATLLLFGLAFHLTVFCFLLAPQLQAQDNAVNNQPEQTEPEQTEPEQSEAEKANVEAVGPSTLNDSVYNPKPPAFGRNRRHFVHGLLGFQWMMGSSLEGEVNVMHNKSFTFDVGLRYKLKATNFLAFTLDAYYRLQRVRLVPNSDFPDFFVNDEETIKMPGFGSALAVRFNLKPDRGNDIGLFLDMGANLFLPINPVYITGNEDPLPNSDEYITTIRSRIDYIRQVRPGLVARLGWRNLALQMEYDLVNMFDGEGENIDLPRFKLGFQVGIH